MIRLIIALLLSPSAYASSVTLAWDANAETNIVAYRLYWGSASRSYTWSNQVPASVLTNRVSDVPANVPMYYAVTAVSADGLESDYSVEVQHTVTNQLTFTCILEESCDLVSWDSLTNVVILSVDKPMTTNLFYRIRVGIK